MIKSGSAATVSINLWMVPTYMCLVTYLNVDYRGEAWRGSQSDSHICCSLSRYMNLYWSRTATVVSNECQNKLHPRVVQSCNRIYGYSKTIKNTSLYSKTCIQWPLMGQDKLIIVERYLLHTGCNIFKGLKQFRIFA